MFKKIEDILAQCIEDVKAGRSSVEDCLAKHHSISKQLEPLLKIALEIQETPDVKPSPAFKVRARVQLMEQIHAKQTVTKWPWFRYSGQVKPIPYKTRFNMVAIIVAVVLAVSALGGGTAYASQGSLPGDVLYPVKLGTEQARLVLATNDVDKAELYLTFAGSRIEEMAAMAEKGKPQEVDQLIERYTNQLQTAMHMAEQSEDADELLALIQEHTLYHQTVLQGLLDNEIVPEQAREAIEKAIAVSERGHTEATGAIEDVPPDGVPPDDVPPDGVPPEDVPPEDVPPDGVPPEDVPPDGVPPEDVPPEDVPPDGVLPEDVPPDGE